LRLSRSTNTDRLPLARGGLPYEPRDTLSPDALASAQTSDARMGLLFSLEFRPLVAPAASIPHVLHCTRDMQNILRTQTITPHIALHWGIKAAQAGLPLSSNPYRAANTRAAWDAGHRQMATMDGYPA
jgi:hypothetical protein